MNKREAKIGRLLSRWKPRLMLDGWAILVEYPEVDKPVSSIGTTGELTTLAEVIINPTYTEARIKVFPEYFIAPYGQQVATLVHELCHLHTYKLKIQLDILVKHKLMTQKAAIDMHEAFTEQMAKLMIRSYKRGKKNASYHL